MKKAIFVVLIILILFVGLTTDLKYGDDIFHFWFAKDWYESGSRPVYNKLVDTMEETNYRRFYLSAPMWHFLLQNLFKISPQHPKVIAQVLQAVFYSLLIIGTFLLAKELYGREIAWFATVITATIPMFLAFSVILFMDVPVAALTPFLFFFMLRRNYLLMGLLLGLMFLTKRNAYLLVPSIAIFVLFNNLDFKNDYSYKRVLPALAIIFLLVSALNVNDLFFRYHNFGGLLAVGDQGKVLKFMSYEKAVEMKTDELYEIFGIKKYGIKKVSNIYFTESATRPKNIFKFLGIPVFLLFFFYLVGFRILFQKQDLILIISIVLYILFFNMVFKNYYAVRYLSPIIPLFAILAAKGIKGIQKRPIRALVIALCFVQFAAVLSFVYTQRRLTEDERAAMQYIREKTPGEIRILTNEEPLVSYYTGRPTAWVNSFSWGRKFIFYKLLWGTELEEKISILKTFKINYIYMPKHRVYDDSNVRHYGGFPLTFVNTLPKLAQIEYDNNKVTLWRVNNYPVQQD